MAASEDTPGAPTERHKLFWVPNALTLSRIASIPFLIFGILHVEQSGAGQNIWAWVISLVFLYAMASDFLDGYWARKWGLVSDFGRMIDPIADKLLVAACLIAFAIVTNGHWLVLIPASAVIFRDILVSGAREHAALAGRAMPPTQLAKWKTACEMIAIAILIYWVIRGGLSLHIGQAFLWLAATLSVYTGSLYVRAALKA